jgi:hypothetical protein
VQGVPVGVFARPGEIPVVAFVATPVGEPVESRPKVGAGKHGLLHDQVFGPVGVGRRHRPSVPRRPAGMPDLRPIARRSYEPSAPRRWFQVAGAAVAHRVVSLAQGGADVVDGDGRVPGDAGELPGEQRRPVAGDRVDDLADAAQP